MTERRIRVVPERVAAVREATHLRAPTKRAINQAKQSRMAIDIAMAAKKNNQSIKTQINV
jgi:hypothetical protein